MHSPLFPSNSGIQPFIELAQSSKTPAAAAQLVTVATSAPQTFTFTELLQEPNIQALADSPEHSSYHTLLQIFSYGTYETYRSTPGLPALNDAQELKLRQLSIVSAARSRDQLSYARLGPALGLQGDEELAETVISAIYAGLITATLDPARSVVQVSKVSPLRDLSPGSVPDMVAALRNWEQRCSSTLDELEAQVQAIRATAAQREKRKKLNDEKLKLAIQKEKGSSNAGNTDIGSSRDALPRRGQNKRPMAQAGGASQSQDDMDIDVTANDSKRAGKRKM